MHNLGQKSKKHELEITQEEVKHHFECFQKKRLDDDLHGKLKHGSFSFVLRRYTLEDLTS